MKRKGECIIPVPYPTHRDGTPVHPYELDYTTEWEAAEQGLETNNHHLNYCRKLFGRFTLSRMFRDLETWQTPLVIPEHVRLHQLYAPGIKLPPATVMMDELELAHEEGAQFKIWDGTDREYKFTPVTPDNLKLAALTYRAVIEASR